MRNPGQITCNKIIVTLYREPGKTGKTDFNLDLSAFMLNSERKLVSDDYLVFYNNLKSFDSALLLSGDDILSDQTGKYGNKQITVNLSKVNKSINEILFTATISKLYLGLNFGHVRNPSFRISDARIGPGNVCMDQKKYDEAVEAKGIFKIKSAKVLIVRSRWSISISMAICLFCNYLIHLSGSISLHEHLMALILVLPYMLLAVLYLFAYNEEINSFDGFFNFKDFVVRRNDLYDDHYDGSIKTILSVGLGLSIIILPLININLLLLALSIPVTILLSRLVMKKLLLKHPVFIFLIPLIALTMFLLNFYK